MSDTRAGDRRDLVVVAAAVCLVTLPFLTKPFHIDDDIYIKGAEQILREPGNPLGGTQVMLGERMPTYHFTQHPPLLSYWIAAVMRLTGEARETPLHIAFLPFAFVAAFAIHHVAGRFTRLPLAATLLSIATPAFVVAAHSVMTDLPFLACSMLAVAGTVAFVDSGRRLAWAATAIGIAGAAGMQYRGLILVPLLALYAWLHRRRLGATLGAGLPTVALLAFWCAHNLWTLGTIHLLDAGSWLEFRPARVAGDAIAYVSFAGGGLVALPFIVYVASDDLRRPASLAVFVGLTAAAGAGFTSGYDAAQRLAFAAFFGAGLALLSALRPVGLPLLDVMRRAERPASPHADDTFLLAMVAVPLASQVVLNIFASVRSLLIVMPFVVMLALRRTEGRPSHRGWVRGAIVLGGVCSAAVALADARFARAAREVAQRAAAHRPERHAAWFTGEWGFRHYIERQGFRPLTSQDQRFDAGDVVVVPDVACASWRPAALDGRFTLIDTLEPRTTSPLTTMSVEARAGFYSNFWGLLPYARSRGPLERARVFRVGADRAVDAPEPGASGTR